MREYENNQVKINEFEVTSYDDMVHPKGNIEDLRLALVQEYLYDIESHLYEKASKISKEKLLKELDMIDDELKPKNIGLLMFNDIPENFIQGCQLHLVHFLGLTSDKFIEKTFHGPIHEKIRAVLRYMENFVITSKNIKGNRIYNYPLESIKEAVVNAVYHRNYSHGTPTEIIIDKEKIVIINYPGSDKFIKKEDIDKGEVLARKYRNKRIGESLKKLKLSTGRATGLSKIMKAMKDNNSKEPIFETDENRSYFMVKLYVNSYFLDEKEKRAVKSNKKEQRDILLNKREDKILELLAHGPLSKKELSNYLGYGNKSENLKRAICKLLEHKLITYTVPSNIKSRNQKYKLIEERNKF
ncbi:ATP-binding protein [Clostridium intestinale]|uniref:Uncharacterized protein n=1 Tax=Clostridium intestinale TaxID=36845 RepID=A0A7D6VPL6_9CLOT|nr:ATP-binding protein [Clostridium intestinale]QLY78829.1 hypothetical protein HZF06_17315 [Clostridium intestinale]